MSKHTPGPWEVIQDFYIRRLGKIHSLAEVKCGDIPADAVDEHKANARLIAAAPDLLAACQAWADYFDDLDARSGPDDKLAEARRKYHAGRIAQCRAAIAKAIPPADGKGEGK